MLIQRGGWTVLLFRCARGPSRPAAFRASGVPLEAILGPAADDQVVLVVRRTPKPPAAAVSVITRHDPAITAADRERARIAANHAPRPLGPARDEPWRAYVR